MSKWELIPWDGNPALGHMCWRKQFGRGKGRVYVGCADFLTVVFSYGRNAEKSYSSTRWDYDRPPITEEDAMLMVDRGKGKTMAGRQSGYSDPRNGPTHR